jgi:plasmid stability protein
MATIQIPDSLEMALEEAAHRAGLSKNELAQEILSAHLEDESLPLSALTEAQLARLDESVAQLGRGERISSEQIDLKFKAFFEKLATR